MVSRVLEQQKAIAQVLSQDRGTRLFIPTWQDTDVLEAISKTLGPLVDFTDALSGDKYKKILDYLNEKYSDLPTQELLDIATALGPRFKMKYSSEVSQESVKARLTREMKEMTETPVMQMPTESDDTEEAKKKRRKKGLGSFFKVPEGTSPGGAGPALHPDEVIAFELQAYLQVATLDTEEDPLE
ncbi:uncharacterized protein [Nothobranchius furzeri]|uniref:uncharacterized protein isoform X2 n=1 Tax=Nothobranchius furzeri TaxID=105023 RepID=UPI00390468E6